MNTFSIVSLTLNPSLDKSTNFNELIPEQKIRCSSPRFDAGGGGVNVSKAISRLGGTSKAIFTAGGATGQKLKDLVASENFTSEIIGTEAWTRENFIAVEESTKKQYRFGFEGGTLSKIEQKSILESIKNSPSDFLVVSGSLNPGVPSNFYVDVAKIAKANNSKLVIDTSGEALEKVLEIGTYLIKPNIVELAQLVGVASLEVNEVELAAKKIINKGGATIIVVSLGALGAAMVTKNSYDYVAAPNVDKKSTVGAGDSMVGGVVWALSQNKSLNEVMRWGVACGSAATMNEGTQLFKKEDALVLFDRLTTSN